ncbi:MAG: tetratricopeptide repeat protein [Oligoflexales bacterium]
MSGSVTRITGNAAVVIIAGDSATNASVRSQLQTKGFVNIREFTRGSECLSHLSKQATDILYLASRPTDMDVLTFVRAARTGPTFAVMPIILLVPRDNFFTVEEREFLKSYQVTIVKSKPSEFEQIESSLDEDIAEIRGDPQTLQSRVDRAKVLLREGLLKEARKIYEDLLAESESNLVARVGLVKAIPNAPEEQFKQLQTLLEQDPKNYYFKFSLIDSYAKHDRHELAYRLLEAVVQDLVENKDVFWANELGIVCVSAKLFSFSKKIALRLAAIATGERAWLAHLMLSRTHLAATNLQEARRHLIRAERLAATSFPEIQNIRAILARKDGDHESAILSYLEAFSLAPDDYRFPYNIGLCYEHIGNIEDAIKYFKIALSLSPGFEKAEEHLRKHGGHLPS